MRSLRSIVRFVAVLSTQFAVSGLGLAQGTPGQPTTQPATPPPTSTEPTTSAPAAAAEPAAEAVPARRGARAGEEEIVVTGTRIRRKDLTTPAPVTVINRDQISASSKVSIGEFLQQLPEHGGALNTQVNNGGDGQTQINLRNLGSNRTLVLVDGKRMVNGGVGVGTAVDLNSIPTSAVERVEVLKDGGSAVYGSDAIAGVVNIITRKRMDGVEANAYTGLSQHGDANVYDVNLLAGATSGKGSFLVGAGYYDQEKFFAGARDWAANALSWDFNAHDSGFSGSPTTPKTRVNALNPANCAAVSTLCSGLLAAYGPGSKLWIYDPGQAKPGVPYVQGWRQRDADIDFYNYQSVNYLVTPQERKSLFGNGEYRVSDFARAYFQTSYVQRQSKYLVAPEPFSTSRAGVIVSANNAFNPFKVDLPSVQRRLTDLSGRGGDFDVNTYRMVAGVDGTLGDFAGPLKGWYWDVALNFGRAAGEFTNSGFLNTQKTQPGLGPTDASGTTCLNAAGRPIANCTPINLFGPPGTISPDMATQLGAYTGTNYGVTQLFIVGASATGDLFSLLADRPVSLAFGYEHRNEYGLYQNQPILAAGYDSDTGAPGPVDTRGGFYVNEGYGEVVAPIVSGMPGAYNLELQAAARAFNYNTFGGDITYKFGLRWSPIRDFTVRGTYSTAFRAPNILELYLGQSGGNFESSNDPCANTRGDGALATRCDNAPGRAGGLGTGNNGFTVAQVNSVNGGNPALQPEKAKIATAGIVFEPQMVRGLTLTGDFYWIELTQQIGAYGTQLILNKCYGAGNVPQDLNSCALIDRDPSTHELSRVTDIAANVGGLVTRGIDVGAQYQVPWTDYGRFVLRFTGTYLLTYDYKDPSGITISGAGNYDGQGQVIASGSTNFNPRVKFNTGVNYTIGGFGANVMAFFLGPLTECAPDGGQVAGSNTGPGFCYQHSFDPATGLEYAHHDVSASWRWDASVYYGGKWPLGNTTLAFGVRNVFDQRPPRLYDAFLSYADPAYDFVGRFFYTRLEHRF